MSTQDIKDHLAEFFPNEAFKRLNKCKDELDYTHRAMKSSNRILVITTDCDEDSMICNQVEVTCVPLSIQMKDWQRPYLTTGPLTGFIFDSQTFDGGPVWLISPEYLWISRAIISDSHAHDELLAQFGFCSAMESVFEIMTDEEHLDVIIDVDAVNNMLITLGAKRVSMPNFQE